MRQSPGRLFTSAVFLFILLLTGTGLRAQLAERYSTINYLNKKALFYAVDTMSHPDTLPPLFQIYHPLYRNETAFLDQGNIVSAYRPLIFRAERQDGLNMGMQNPYNYYLYTPDNIPLFKVRRAYTDLSYFQGAGELIGIKALHSQNIRPNWNIGIDYRRIKSDGFQENQKTSVYNTRLFNWYHTPDERYHLIVTATFNRLRNEENGGLTNDTVFEDTDGLTQYPVRSSVEDRADRISTAIKTNDYRITNMFRLGPAEKLKYFVPEDSTYVVDTNAVRIPSWVVAHEFAYTGTRYLYQDPTYDTGEYLYPYTLFNDVSTFDSIQHSVISNSLSISNGPFMGYLRDTMPVKRWLMLSANAGYDYHFIVWQTLTNVRYYNTYVGGSISSNPYAKSRLKFNAEGRFWLTGYNQADYKVKGRLGFDFGPFVLEGRALFQAYEPQVIEYFFLGNHNFYKNDFDKTFANSISGGLHTTRFRHNYHLSVTQQLINNYIYFDSTLTARQEAKAISVTQVNFRKRFQLGKFNLDNNITTQVTNNNNLLRIPALATRNSLFFESFMFKRALFAQIGVDFFYYSEVTAHRFDPETRQYYLQNQAKTGNYPWFDVYVNGHVKTVNFFLKMEHVTQGLFGKRYYASPHYPNPGRVFRLGISWKFFD